MITRCRVLPLVLLSCLASVRLFAFADPFTVSASLSSAGGDKSFLTLSIKIPPKHYLYADTFRLDLPAGVEITTQTVPLPTNEFDTFSQTTRGKYTHDVVLTYFLARVPPILSLTVHYQGCSETTCFLPSSKHFEFKAGVATVSNSESSSAATVSSEATETRQLTHHFSIVGTAVGYMPADKFLQFLENSKRGNGDIKNRWMGKPEGSSIPFALLLILLGGLALNLTPCVLPLIPINLAIIGAGARAGSRARGSSWPALLSSSARLGSTRPPPEIPRLPSRQDGRRLSSHRPLRRPLGKRPPQDRPRLRPGNRHRPQLDRPAHRPPR